MHAFTDRTGAKWVLDVTVASIERVKAKLGLDLPGLFGDDLKGLDALLGNDLQLVEVIGELVSSGPPADNAAERLTLLKAVWDGTTADAAVDAFLEDLINFFRDPNRRATLRQLLGKLREIGARVHTKSQAMVAETDADQVGEHIVHLLKNSPAPSMTPSGAAPASSASTPGLSPSASSI